MIPVVILYEYHISVFAAYIRSIAVLPICHCIPPDRIPLWLYNELHVMIASRPKVVIIPLFSEALIIS